MSLIFSFGALALGAASPDPAATLAELDARLLAGGSATRTLESWCREHRLAADPRIVAERVRGADKPISAEQRARLGIDAAEPVRYRHVRLRCGTRILSEADNWYVPARLTPEMNAALDGSDVPFGTVVAPLGIGRRTLSTERLWQPGTTRAMPRELIRHRAIVHDRAMRPIAEVTETYQAPLLDVVPPR
jgi:chorismate-pyruvate lyase